MDLYVPNNIVSKYRKQQLTELKGKIEKSKIIEGNSNRPLSIEAKNRKKIVKI